MCNNVYIQSKQIKAFKYIKYIWQKFCQVLVLFF